MKLISLIVALLVAGFAFPLSAAAQTATNPFQIKRVLRVTNSAIDNRVQRRISLAELRVDVIVPTGVATIVAYFFDDQNRLVVKRVTMGPADASGNAPTSETMPMRSGRHNVIFQANDDPKWTHVVIFLGNAHQGTAVCYPTDDVSRYDFPEKQLVLQSGPAGVR